MTAISSSPIEDAESRIQGIVNSNVRGLGFTSGSAWRQSLPQIENVADSALCGLLATFPDENVEAIINVIKVRRQQLPLSSSTGAQITSLCGQLLAFGAAGLALAVGFADKIASLPQPLRHVLFLLGIFYALLVIVSLIVIFIYLLQATFRYPYLYFDKIGNAWPSFYYASISLKVSRQPVQFPRQQLRAAGLYAEDLLSFAQKCVNETPKERLRNELQQYFLLIAYQAYSHQFSLRLGNTFIYGLVGAFSATVITFIISLFIPR
jgi:hypothetical protein